MDESDVDSEESADRRPGEEKSGGQLRCRWCDCEKKILRRGEVPGWWRKSEDLYFGGPVTVQGADEWRTKQPMGITARPTCWCGCGIHPRVMTFDVDSFADDSDLKRQFELLETMLGREFWVDDQGYESGCER